MNLENQLHQLESIPVYVLEFVTEVACVSIHNEEVFNGLHG